MIEEEEEDDYREKEDVWTKGIATVIQEVTGWWEEKRIGPSSQLSDQPLLTDPLSFISSHL